MRKNTLNFLVDVVTLLTMLSMIFTGLLLKFVLPPRRGTGPHQMLWGWDRHDWGGVHFWIAVTLGSLLLLHVALHWQWVCATVGQFFRRGEARTSSAPPIRNAWGVGFLILVVALVGGFLWFASANVQSDLRGEGRGRGSGSAAADERSAGRRLAEGVGPERGRGGRQAERGIAELHVRGSMTLAEIERLTGIPVTALRTELSLPDDVSPDEKLGRLRREHGFEMSDVREAVQRLRQQQTPP